MLFKERATGHIVDVEDLAALIDPYHPRVEGRMHYGEERQDAEAYAKDELAFLSGEPLPRCWTDPHYRDHEARQRGA